MTTAVIVISTECVPTKTPPTPARTPLIKVRIVPVPGRSSGGEDTGGSRVAAASSTLIVLGLQVAREVRVPDLGRGADGCAAEVLLNAMPAYQRGRGRGCRYPGLLRNYGITLVVSRGAVRIDPDPEVAFQGQGGGESWQCSVRRDRILRFWQSWHGSTTKPACASPVK
jgi:hypothetical protein